MQILGCKKGTKNWKNGVRPLPGAPQGCEPEPWGRLPLIFRANPLQPTQDSSLPPGSPGDTTRCHETSWDATRRWDETGWESQRGLKALDDVSETPPRRDLDDHCNDFAWIFGMVFGAFCIAYVLSDFLLFLRRFFHVLLKDNLMIKLCAIEDF